VEAKGIEQNNARASIKNRDRRVVGAGEFTDDEIALIAKAEVPAEYAHLDELIKDWTP